MDWIKWLHVLGVILYAGGVMGLSRLLGHAVRFESEGSRADSYRIFKRMHKFVDLGGLGILLVTGLWLAIADPWGKGYLKQGYFHLKLTFVLVLVVCEVLFSRKLFRLEAAGPQPKVTFFRIVHGLIGLAVIGALLAIFVVRG